MKLVAELLAIPRFSNLRLLTDPLIKSKSPRPPDIAHYIPEHTFILSTAMVYKDKGALLADDSL